MIETIPPIASVRVGVQDRYALNGYTILVFDTSNTLVDVPGDIFDGKLSTVVNGGAADGTLSFARYYNQIGAIGEGYRVQFYLPASSEPWWDGRVVEIDQEQKRASGQVIAQLEGWFTHLNDANVSFYLSPGMQPNGQDNGQMDYADLLNWMVPHYALPGISWSTMPASGVNVPTLQVQNQGLADTLDTAAQSILDNDGRHYQWTCDGASDLSIVASCTPVQFNAATALTAIVPGDLADYTIRTSWKSIKNMLVITGGNDANGVTVWGTFSDSASIGEYGLRQGALQNTYLVSDEQLAQYASAQLAQMAYPQYTGSFRVVRPTAAWRAGVWVQVIELPGTGVAKTFRLGKVTIAWSRAGMLEMTCEPSAPIPRIDNAIFDATQRSAHSLRGVTINPTGATALSNVSSVISGGALM